MVDIPSDICRTKKRLSKDLEKPLNFLSTYFKIPGFEAGDLRNMMIENIIKIYNKDRKYYSRRKLGFWFIRSKWFLLGLRKSTLKRDVVVSAISYDQLVDINEWDKV